MKVKAQTPEMVVIDLESQGAIDYTDEELNDHIVFADMFLPKVVRIFKDRMEMDVNVIGKSKKTLKIYYHDAILVNRVIHRICRKKDERYFIDKPIGSGKSSPYKPLSEGDICAPEKK